MRIIENSSATLRLRDRSLLVSLVCFGAALLIAGVFAAQQGDLRALAPAGLFALFGLVSLHTSDVTFDKATRICTVDRFDVVRRRRREFRFDDIKTVNLEIGRLQGNRQVFPCRLSIVAANGTFPLTAGYEYGQPRVDAMRTEIMNVLSGGIWPHNSPS